MSKNACFCFVSSGYAPVAAVKSSASRSNNLFLTCGRNFFRSAKLKPAWLCSLLIEIFIIILSFKNVIN